MKVNHLEVWLFVILLIVIPLILAPVATLAFAQDPTIEPTVQPTAEVTPTPIPDPTEPPPVEDDPITLIIGIIASLGALVSSMVVNLIKSIPGLSEGDKSKLSGAAAEVISVVVGLITGFIVSLAGQALGLIDPGLQSMAVAMAVPVLAEVRYRVVKLAPAK